MEIFYLFGFVLVISAPLFYLRGLYAFIQFVFGSLSPKTNSSQSDSKSKFVAYFFQRLEENPDLSIRDFLTEMQEKQSPETVVNEETQAEPVPAIVSSVPLSDLVSAPAISRKEPKPIFSWREWYADHSIDFILYLGAFMIVAAVSLFVGFQWENFDDITRFVIVITFTIAWYLGGIVVQRVLSLDGVAIAFMTIGAVITPFCGVAWQRFVIGTMDNVGITWLITSLIGTAIYMILSLVYQRRHFTYFGNLSILATILSIVEISDSPDEFFILASAVTALILLLARIALKHLAPRLDAYLGQDFERSSLAVLLFSIVAGVLLIPLTGLPIFSVEVLAVMVVTLLYVGAYLTLHFNRYTVVIAQILAIVTLSHAFLTFSVDLRFSLYITLITLITSIILQFVVNRWLDSRHPEIFAASNLVGVLISGVAYWMSIVLAEGGFLAIPAILILIGHTSFYAMRFKNTPAWYVVSILFYPLLAHTLFWLNIEFQFWASAYMLLSIIQLSVMLTTIDTDSVKPFVHTGLIAMGLAGLMSIFIILDNTFDTMSFFVNVINPFVVFISYAAVMLAHKSRSEWLFPALTPIGLASVSIVYFLIGTEIDPMLIPILWGISVSILFWIAQSLTNRKELYFVVFAAPYVLLYYILFTLNMPLEAYPIAYTLLGAVTFFAIILPDETDFSRQIVSIIGLGIVSVLAFATATEDGSIQMHYAGWLSGYTFLGMLWLSRSLLGKDIGNIVFAIAAYIQYSWHIYYLQEFVSFEIFSNIQWYSAAAAFLLIAGSMMMIRRRADETSVLGLQLFSVAVLMLPTLAQILDTQALLYFGLGVSYSLIIAAVAITFSQNRLRTLAAISLVLVVLSQSSDFLLNLPRWIVIGVIGFGLIGAGLYLSIRRRTVKKEV